MKTLLKLFALTIIFNGVIGCTPANKSPNDKVTSNENKQWVEVLNFKGSGMKSSKSFDLTGGEARIKYDYHSHSEMVGMFGAYILPSGYDLMNQGGIADVMITNVEESGESYIQKSAGKYFMTVNAAGNWIVTVEELR